MLNADIKKSQEILLEKENIQEKFKRSYGILKVQFVMYEIIDAIDITNNFPPNFFEYRLLAYIANFKVSAVLLAIHISYFLTS